MKVDWQRFRARHGHLFSALVVVKRMRTKVGIALVIACLVEQLYLREPPLDLAKPNVWVSLGLLLIGVGSIVRLAALGSLRKKMELATSGVYSLCRHPLYLGSILIGLGFCVLLRNLPTYFVAAGYFAVFFPLTIVWEEIRLDERYGEEYRTYRNSVPLLLPTCAFPRGSINVRRALGRGGFTLLVCECLMLGIVEMMAKTLR